MRNTVYDSQGNVLWSAEIGSYLLWPAVVQLDDDPQAEIAFLFDGGLVFYDHEGNFIAGIEGPGEGGNSVPCAADFDGDGLSEVAWSRGFELVAYDNTGELMWAAPKNPRHQRAGELLGPTDLDNDGSAEVLVSDESAFRVLGGRDGKEIFVDFDHSSGTGFEYPVISDVDGDAWAEVLVIHNRLGGCSSTAHRRDLLRARARRLGDDGHPVVELRLPFRCPGVPDGTVPTLPPTPWLTYNLLHSRPVEDPCGNGREDLCEECDDAGDSGDCDFDCTFAECGDGYANANAEEECDDGEGNSDTTADACRTDCALPFCGDGVVDSAEACDDGDDDDGDGCDAECGEEYGYVCDLDTEVLPQSDCNAVCPGDGELRRRRPGRRSATTATPRRRRLLGLLRRGGVRLRL